MQNGEELQKALLKNVPAKIDIGPVYTVDPRRRKAYTGKGLSKWMQSDILPYNNNQARAQYVAFS